MSENGEIYTADKKFTLRRQWRHGQIPPLCFLELNTFPFGQFIQRKILSSITNYKIYFIIFLFARSVQHGPQNHLAHMNKLIEFCDTGVKEVG